MKKIFTIARWEFFEKVKRKSFIISMVVTPLILFALVYFSSLYSSYEKESPSPIGLLDTTGKYSILINIELSKYILNNGQPSFVILDFSRDKIPVADQLSITEQMLLNNDIYGLLFIHESDSLKIEYRSGGIYNPTEFLQIEQAVQKAITKYNLDQLGLPPSHVQSLFYNKEIIRTEINNELPASEEEFITSFLTGYFFILLLLIMILFAGGMFVRSIVEEKSNRIIEVILSSCKIDQLLAGKIMGLSWLGMFQIIMWVVIGGLIFGGEFIKLNLSDNFWWQIIFFILGYILYTAIFVGIGSIVNTEHEAQQITANLSIVLIIPILIASQVLLYPDSAVALILSYFPLTTAPAMILRMNIITPSLLEIFITIAISITSIYFVIRLSSKIFKIGIFSYGKKLSIKELIERLKPQHR